ncbi:cytochrome b5-like [Centruroides sculpturatus]|uniref:cytochrome b5-like n=1 Tax=Centruroides sculpturatus TaxID=218467 RepID=UPI000C6DF05A|nr:cytochrome b5-like [Centruroides sculpturatus]
MRKSASYYTLAEVRQHCEAHDCWIIIYDKIYDVTHFLSQHPGGEYILLENAGRDATLSFLGAYHSNQILVEAEKYCIGYLVQHERLNFLQSGYDTIQSTS